MTTPREQRLADTFVLLSDTLVHDFDLVDFFQLLTDRCVELLDITAAGLFLTHPVDGSLYPCAWTPPTVRTGALMATATQGSPATHCLHTAGPVASHTMDQDDVRYPVFIHQARQAGYQHTAAVPLRLRDQLLGSMLVLNTTAATPAPADLPMAQALADQAAIGLLHQRALTTTTGRVPTAQLHSAVHGRIIVEQARGFLSVFLDNSLDDAYEAMRHHARTHGQPLTTVATQILDQGLRPISPPPPRQAHEA